MQFLLFHLGPDSYGLRTRHVARVLPLMDLKQIPLAPPHVAGLMNLHGTPVPVIDLCMLAQGRPSARQYDTRIVLVNYPGEDGGQHPLGLIVERATGMTTLSPEEFADSRVANDNARFLGQVTTAGGTIIQLIEVRHLLDDSLRALLYPTPAQGVP